MNEMLALQENASAVRTAAAPALYVPAEVPVEQPSAADSRTSSDEIARKIMRLTGNVRLVSRAAHSWHHCGINE